MKLKYYLRGLGIGIAVTAFIMSRTVKTEELTDAQIKLRALELGMVEETVLADLPQPAAEENSKTDVEDSVFEYTAGEAEIMGQEEENALQEESDANQTVNSNTENGETTEETEIPTENPSAAENGIAEQKPLESTVNEAETGEVTENYIIITVEPGNGSETVSRRMYNVGLVESAVEYNRFLVNNGYDRNLVVGNHEIPVGASEEEMARILCGLE